MGNGGVVYAEAKPHHDRPASALLTLPPLGVCIFKPKRALPPLPSEARQDEKLLETSREDSAATG